MRSDLRISSLLLFGLSMSILATVRCDSQYYIDSVNGDDGASGTAEAPLKTLTKGLSRVGGVPGTLFLKQGQTFSDLTKLTAISANLTIKSWGDDQPATIFLNQADSSFDIQKGFVTFHNIQFQRSTENTGQTIVQVTGLSTTNLSNVTFSNLSCDHLAAIVDVSSPTSTVILENTRVLDTNLNSSTIVNIINGTLLLNNFTMKGCTTNKLPGFMIMDIALTVQNSTFESNILNDNSIFLLLGETSNVEMDTVTVMNNTAYLQTPFEKAQLATFFTSLDSNAQLYFTNCIFSRNKGVNGTSGLQITGSMLTIVGCKFTNNKDTFWDDIGSPKGYGVLRVSARVVSIMDSVFENNMHAFGGAISITKNKKSIDMTISESTFDSNQALFGGAVYVEPNIHELRLVVHDSSFDYNLAAESTNIANDGGSGGAFYFAYVEGDDHDCCFERNKFFGNVANAIFNEFGISGAGGAIYYQPNENNGNCTLKNNEFKENYANFGGAILFKRGLNLKSENNTFADNHAWINGGATSIQKVNYSEKNNRYWENSAQFGGAVFLQEGIFLIDAADFDGNHASYNGACLSAKSVSQLIIKNSDFIKCESSAIAGALSISTNSMSEIRDVRFTQCKALQGSAIYFSENFLGPQKIEGCSFLNNTSEFSLMQSLLSRINGSNLTVENNKGTVLAQVSTSTNFTNVSVLNTECQRTHIGCLLDAISTDSHFTNINVTNMKMHPENSGISLRQKEHFSMTNAVFTNVQGSLSGACLLASNTTVVLENWTVKNFYSGCVSVTNTNATIRNFTMDNYEYSQKYNNTDNPQQVGAALFLNSGYNFTVTGVTIRGNQNITSRGAAIDVENSTYFHLQDAWLEDNSAETGGGLYIGFMPANVVNVTFKNNTAQNGGGLYAVGFGNMNETNATQSFANLTFIENHAVGSGGAVHFENVQDISLVNSTFIENAGFKSIENSLFEANSKGGALYYSCIEEHCKVDLRDCNFTNNAADIGGAIYFNNHIFYPKNSLFINNSATSQGGYGPIFGSYPIQLLYGRNMKEDDYTKLEIVFENGTTIRLVEYIRKFFYDPNNFTEAGKVVEKTKTTLRLEMYNQTGGQPYTQNITFYAIDHFGQQISVDFPEFYIQLIQDETTTGGEVIKSPKIQSAEGAFMLSGGFLTSPGTNLKLTIKTNIFDLVDDDEKGLYTNTTFSMQLGFRNCSIGEILPINTNVCSLCPPSTFSLYVPVNSSVTCASCNKITGAVCKRGGSDLRVLPGYWRLNNLSTNVVACSNQRACLPMAPNVSDCNDPRLAPNNIQSTCLELSTPFESKFPYCSSTSKAAVLNYCEIIQNGTSTGACNQGYQGILCGECQDGWGSSSAYKCVRCDKTVSFFVQLVGFCLLRLSLIGYTVYQAHEGKRNKDQSSTLRILINFFQVINMLLVVPFQWPPIVDSFKSYILSLFSSGTTTVGGFSYECIVNWLGLEESTGFTYFQMNAFYAFISPIYWTIILSSLIALRFKLRGKSLISMEYKEAIFITFIVTYFYIWPDLMTVAFSLFNCVEVGGRNSSYRVLQTDPTLECYTSKHWVLLATSAFPSIILWGIAIPLLYFLTIRRNKMNDMLGDETFARKYGFIYQGYTRRFYWWEFIILGRKVVLLIISVFLVRNLNVMCLTLLLACILWTGLQLRASPYTNIALNSLELTSLFSIGAILYACLYHLSLYNEGSTISFVGVAAIVTLIFFVQWVGYYFVFLREKIAYYWNLFKSGLLKVAGFFGYQPNYAEREMVKDEEDEDAMAERRPSSEQNRISLRSVSEGALVTRYSHLQEPLLEQEAGAHSLNLKQSFTRL